MDRLKVVEFPSIFKYENKIFGVYSSIELLVVLIASSAVGLILKNLGSYAIAFSIATFLLFTFLKLATPEEAGFGFISYELKFAANRTMVFAHELDQTKNLVSLDFVDGWIVRLGDRLASVIEVYPINFFYSTPAEQRSYIDGFKEVLNSLDFKIQILGIASEFDATRYMNRFLLRLKDEDIASNPTMREIAKDYLNWLDSEIVSSIKRRYFVIVCVADKGEISIGELRRRAETILAGLQRAGIEARILDRDDVLGVYELIFSRKNAPRNFNSSKVLVGGFNEDKS